MLTLQAPSSKSLSHRALICAALTHGNSSIYNILDCDDTQRTMSALEKAGAKFTPLGNSFENFTVEGIKNHPKGAESLEKAIECHINESGTSARLLSSLLSYGEGYFKITASNAMQMRPMKSLISALTALGAEIYTSKNSSFPIYIHAQKIEGGKCEIEISQSSQFLSALLFLAPLCKKGLSITIKGNQKVSWPYILLTLECLQEYGINFSIHNDKLETIDSLANLEKINSTSLIIDVKHGKYVNSSYTVESDWSSASYLIAAGILGKKIIKINKLNTKSKQADREIISIITKMNGKLEITDNEIIASPSSLQAIEIDMKHCPDIVPTVAILASCANGISYIKNIKHLRFKESDRIQSLMLELDKVGIRVEENEDSMIIHGKGHMPKLENRIFFSAHNDHRIAMSLSLLALSGNKIDFDNKEVVKKSFSNYWKLFEEILK